MINIEFVFSCTVLFVSISQVIGCEDRLRNDLCRVGWGVKLYSNQTKRAQCSVWVLMWRAGNDGRAGGNVQIQQPPADNRPALSSSARLSSSSEVQTSSHFMPYFITVTVIVVMLYVVYHKRNLVNSWIFKNNSSTHFMSALLIACTAVMKQTSTISSSGLLFKY